MPMKINGFGSSIPPTEQPGPSSGQSTKAASPSPQELQARIEQGIQKAAQNLDQIMGTVTGNASLAPVDVKIQEAMKEIHDKQRDETAIKDTVKHAQDSGDSQLQKAARSLDQITGTITDFGNH